MKTESRMRGHKKGGCCLKAAELLGSLSCDTLQLLKPQQVGPSAEPCVTCSRISFTAGAFQPVQTITHCGRATCTNNTAGKGMAAGKKTKWVFGCDKLRYIFSAAMKKYLIVLYPFARDPVFNAMH